MHPDHFWRIGHSRDQIAIKVILLGNTILKRHLALQCNTNAHYARTLHLRPDSFRVCLGPAVEGNVYPVNGQLARIVHFHVKNNSRVRHKAVVERQAQASPFFSLAPPARLSGGALNHPAHPADIDRVQVRILTVVPAIANGQVVNFPGRPKQVQNIITVVLAGGHRHFMGKALDRPGVGQIVHRSEPAIRT